MTIMGEPTAADVMRALQVISDKLDALIDALAIEDDEDEGVVHSLDGTVVSRPRNADESLG